MNRRTIKSIAALALTGTASALVMSFKTSLDPGGSSAIEAPSAANTPGVAGPTPTSGATGVTAGATYADGTWTGAAVREPWGTFEVEAMVTNGKITNVVLVASPPDGNSSRINRRAVPRLTASAIAAQSAAVDMVSGATWTSQSYATSLQAALDDAKAAAQSPA